LSHNDKHPRQRVSVLFYDSCVTWQNDNEAGTFRHGPTYGFQAMLERLGMSGVWAAPGCIAKLVSFREAERRLHQTNTDYD